MTLSQATIIMKKYNQEPFHIQHNTIVSDVLGHFAKTHAPDQVEHWQIVGILHDTDYELYPEEHCVKGVELLEAEGVPADIIQSAMSHGYGLTKTPFEPTHIMENILYAIDELTGLIGAAALMRPSKSTLDMELKSLKKKFKDKKFAAGCSRDVIQNGATRLGWELDKLLADTLEAMQAVEKDAQIS